MVGDASWVEQVWSAARGSPHFPGWAWFQLAAVIAGGAIVARVTGRDRRLLLAFVVGVLLAGPGAIALGSGAAWVTWWTHGRSGPLPALEIAGFGAIAGLVCGYVLVARATGVARERALDALAPALGAMIAFSRLGCFFAGCDFGAPASVPWALRYPVMTPAFREQLDAGLIGASSLHTLPVHPTQLYEVCVGIVVLVVALSWRAPRREGDRFAVALLLYAAGRFAVDFARGDLPRGGALGLTTTQGFALTVAGMLLAWRAGAYAKSDASAEPAERPLGVDGERVETARGGEE